MPEGTPLERRHAWPRRSPMRRCETAEVRNVQIYVGTAAPYQLQRPRAALLPAPRAEPGGPAGESRRRRTSGANRATTIAKRVRRDSRRSPTRFGATRAGRRGAARAAGAADARRGGLRAGRRPSAWSWRARFARVRADAGRRGRRLVRRSRRSPKWRLDVDTEKAALAGMTAARRRGGRSLAESGTTPGCCTIRCAREDVPIVLQAAAARRRGSLDAAAAPSGSRAAARVADRRAHAGRARRRRAERLSQEPAAGDLRHGRPGGPGGEPGLRDPADEPHARPACRLPEGYATRASTTPHQPVDSTKYAMKWDGEWHITYRGVPRPRASRSPWCSC